MTDYIKATNFASKDSLASGNPLKIVKGTEINTEFDNIAVAVATKADLNSPSFIGTPAAPTAPAGTSTTQLATTAFLATLYPVGTVYTNIAVSTNPATLFGFGTWVAITGRVIVGLDSGDAAFDTVGETGGSKDAIVVSHTHSISDPGHSHSYTTYSVLDADNGPGPNTMAYPTSQTTGGATTGISINSTGSSATNGNLQPYVVAYVWKRTA